MDQEQKPRDVLQAALRTHAKRLRESADGAELNARRQFDATLQNAADWRINANNADALADSLHALGDDAVACLRLHLTSPMQRVLLD